MNYCNNILPIYTADFSGQGTSIGFDSIIWIKMQSRNKNHLSKKSLIDLLELAGIDKNNRNFKENVNKLFASATGIHINLHGSNIHDNKGNPHSEFYIELSDYCSQL